MSIPAGPESLPAPSACLVVLDGWGLAAPSPGNAVSLARTPVFDELWQRYPHTTLSACGPAVGLPDGQMGNSEVGHLNLGAGAVVRQDLVRIDEAIAAGRDAHNGESAEEGARGLAHNEVLRAAFAQAPRVHLVGLVSDGGVHSSLRHLEALIAQANAAGARDVGFLAQLDAHAQARVGSVIGRYWAMDRDRRWERTQRAYDLLVQGRAEHHAVSGEQAALDAYARGKTDEFIEPTLVGEEARIRPALDSVVAFNFRPDRMRQLTRALAEPGFGEDEGESLPGWRGRDGAAAVTRYATLTQYEEDWLYPAAFPPERPATTLAAVIARAGAEQLHVAETEKYAHVTYFFNGGEEAPLAGERRELVPSPREVATYDLKPQMSAREAADAFVAAWRAQQPRFAIINFANPDMVGHTGVIPAAVAAVEAVDERLGEVVASVHRDAGVCVVTADHGNAEHMLEPDGGPNTAHSLNPVPLIVTTPALSLRDSGILADVAPTVLELLGIEQPAQMTGRSLIAAR